MPETFTQKGPLLRSYEGVPITIRQEGKAKQLTFAASSENPVERWFGMEVLSHDRAAVKLKRAKTGAMPLLFNHNLDDPIGMVSKAWIEDSRLMIDADLFDMPRAAEVQAMIQGGLRNVSIAYRVGMIEEDKKAEVYRVTDWEPLEVSIVTVPADPSVGIGRGQTDEYEVRIVRASQPAQRATREESMSKDVATAETKETAAAVVTAEAVQSPNAVEMEKARKRGIENLCKMNNLDEKYLHMWVGQGVSLEEVTGQMLRVLEERSKSNPQPLTRLGMSPREAQSFSLNRAIMAIATQNWKNAPFELECSKAVADRLGRAPDPHTILIPFDVLQRPVDLTGVSKRDLTVGVTTAGGFLVETQNVGFIEMLRNRSVAFRMGARRLSGLTGSVTIPRQSGAASPSWLATEASAAGESDQAFVQISLTPKTVAAYTEISRQLLLQSSPGAEGIVTDDLAQVAAIAADLAVLNGGVTSAGQPRGIINTSGIGSVAGGATPTYATVLEFQTDVATANVTPMAGGYVTTPGIAGRLLAISRFANTDTPLWEGNVWNGRVSGFPAMSSNQMPTGGLLFGDFSEVVVAEWGVLEVEVNPYANFAAGIIGVRVMYSLDVGVRRPFAFSFATPIS